MVAGFILALALGACGPTADAPPYATTIDLIECRPGLQGECLHFYEQNWRVFRQEALEREYISGYRLLRTDPDSAGAVTLVLQTDYPDSASYAAAEEHFQPMMRELRPDGPDLLNAVPRSEFVRNRSAYVTYALPRDVH